MSIHPNAGPWSRKPEIDDPEEYLTRLLRREPRPRRRDAENDVLKRFPWWNRGKPWWRPDGFASSKQETIREGPWSRTGTRQGTHEQRRADAGYQQRQERAEQEQARRKQQGKNNDPNMNRGGIDQLFSAGDRAILAWSVSGTDYAQFCVADDASSDDVAHAMFAALTAMQEERDRAIETIQILVEERRKVREFMATQSPSDRDQDLNALHREVGLDPACPEALVCHVLRWYLGGLHPDRHPPEGKSRAERRFKEVQEAFDEIERLRGTSRRS